MKLFSIDIGTNTMLMVIAEQINSNEPLTILQDIHSIARLGEGVDKTRRISEKALSRALVIAEEYKQICRKWGASGGIAVATSAVRDAENGKEVCTRISEVLDCEVQPISGDREAGFSFSGTVENNLVNTVVDIGGGSTEYVTGVNYNISHRLSLQIGAVRLHERYLKDLPPTLQAITDARNEIRRQLALLPQAEALRAGTFNAGEIIGVGGTFTTLAAMDLGLREFDSARVQNHAMSAGSVSRITDYLLTHSLPDLLRNPAIHPKRADILPAGAIILEETLRFFDAASCKASTKGLRYGVLYEAFKRHRRSLNQS